MNPLGTIRVSRELWLHHSEELDATLAIIEFEQIEAAHKKPIGEMWLLGRSPRFQRCTGKKAPFYWLAVRGDRDSKGVLKINAVDVHKC